MHAQRTDGICTTDKWHSPRKRFSQKSTFFLTLYKFWCNYEFLHTPMTMTKYLPYGYKTLAMGPMPQYTKCPGGGYSFWQKPNNVIKDPRLMDHVQERGGETIMTDSRKASSSAMMVHFDGLGWPCTHPLNLWYKQRKLSLFSHDDHSQYNINNNCIDKF
jgi:hypothetical protein